MSALDQPIRRRSLLGGALALGACPSLVSASVGTSLIAGTYASEGGAGLVPLIASPDGWQAGPALGAIRNASFGVQRGLGGMRYLLDEQEHGTLGVFGPDFRPLARVPTLGADPCHAALSADGRALAVANYSSGSVALWRLDRTTGLPIGETQRVVHTGNGPNRDRQARPHAHWVGFAPNGGVLHAVDLGADAIFAHALDRQSGAVTRTDVAYRATPGSGPRHLARHPRLPIAYLVAELANTVTTLVARRDGSFMALATASTLPAGYGGPSAAAHIALNRAGSRLYVSNRGHDSIAVFAVGRDGALTVLQHTGCGGHWPRFFSLLEGRSEMLVANERSGNIARLRLRADGQLDRAEAGVRIPGVVFLA